MTFSLWLGVTFPAIPPEEALRAIAVMITSEGEVLGVLPAPGQPEQLSLKELQRYVGGYIELVPFKYGDLVCNEEGKLQRLPVNRVATALFKSLIRPGDYFAGNVLVCKKGAIA